MKKILICHVLALLYSCKPTTITYYALFDELPNLYGDIQVTYDSYTIGTARGPAQLKSKGLYVMPLRLDRRCYAMMRSNSFLIATNGTLELRICPQMEAINLPPESGIKSFKNEWAFQIFLLNWNGAQWMQSFQERLPNIPN